LARIVPVGEVGTNAYVVDPHKTPDIIHHIDIFRNARQRGETVSAEGASLRLQTKKTLNAFTPISPQSPRTAGYTTAQDYDYCRRSA
jgi:hypothetical protein